MERWGPGLWAEGEPWVASARTGLVKHPAPLWRHRARWHLVAVSGLPASSRARELGVSAPGPVLQGDLAWLGRERRLMPPAGPSDTEGQNTCPDLVRPHVVSPPGEFRRPPPCAPAGHGSGGLGARLPPEPVADAASGDPMHHRLSDEVAADGRGVHTCLGALGVRAGRRQSCGPRNSHPRLPRIKG